MCFLKKIILLLIFSVFNFILFSNELPRSYDGVTLGMTLEETKSQLEKSSSFGYHGDRDVSLLPGENRVLIETDSSSGLGSKFLDRCYFQLKDDFLYIITINLNKNNMDYYSMFTTLCKKYGEPNSINPETAKWENDNTTIYLEKPLTLKYIDRPTFEKSISTSDVMPAPSEITKEMFLDAL